MILAKESLGYGYMRVGEERVEPYKGKYGKGIKKHVHLVNGSHMGGERGWHLVQYLVEEEEE